MDRDLPAEAAFTATANGLMDLLQAMLCARSQHDWASCLQGGIQSFLPHDALVAAWGDFQGPELRYEVIAGAPPPCADAFPRDVVQPLLAALFRQWMAAGQVPIAVPTSALHSIGAPLFSGSPWALVHGVQDCRSHCDSAYVLVGPQALAGELSQRHFQIALPYLDTAFRQTPDRNPGKGRGEPPAARFSSSGGSCSEPAAPASLPADARPRPASTADEPHGTLSGRELEVMQWVRMGKTNSEIAIILNLSTFTVKNHMRRIYRKLDVLNRAQAVGSLYRMVAPAAAACR